MLENSRRMMNIVDKVSRRIRGAKKYKNRYKLRTVKVADVFHA
jgi:hypothetical protein